MVDKKKKCKITRVRNLIQKQPAEVFFMKICSSNFRKIHRKIPVPESFLIKLQAESCKFIKKNTLAQVFSCEFCKISNNSFFTEHLWATAYRIVYLLLHKQPSRGVLMKNLSENMQHIYRRTRNCKTRKLPD